MKLSFENPEHAQKAIRRLLAAAIKIESETPRAKGESISLPWSIETQLDFWLLESASGGKISREGIWKTLRKMRDENSIEVDDFSRLYSTPEPPQLQAQKQLDNWKIVIPIHIAIPEGFQVPMDLRSLGKLYRLVTWDYALKGMTRTSINNSLHMLRTYNETTKYGITFALTVRTQAVDATMAWNDVEPSFDALRGIIELTLGSYRWKISWPEKPLRSIEHPPWIVIWNRRTAHVESFEFYQSGSKEETARAYTLDRKSLEAIQANVSRFLKAGRSVPNIRETIVNAFRLYTQALDSHRHFQAFLGFWQCAECITLADSHLGKSNLIVDRLCVYLRVANLNQSEVSSVLRLLYKLRNQIVHSGVHDGVGGEAINFMKSVCEAGIRWLMQREKQIPSRAHLEIFHQFHSKNDKALELHRQIIGTICKNRLKDSLAM